MNEPYKIGFCPQCQAQVMVQDTDRQWNSFKPNWRQAYLVFEDGHRVLTTICSDCLENPDFQKLMDAILHVDSQACGEDTKNHLKFVFKPKELQPGQIATQGKLFQLAEDLPLSSLADSKANIIQLDGQVYQDMGDFYPLEKVARGLPVQIRQWSLTGK